jgi:hypothetical protein
MLLHYARATMSTQEEQLSMAVKQYRPRYSDRPQLQPGDVTIIACPALGFPKELYEPIWLVLYELLLDSKTCHIRNVWLADPTTQGVNGLLNEGKLGSERTSRVASPCQDR